MGRKITDFVSLVVTNVWILLAANRDRDRMYGVTGYVFDLPEGIVATDGHRLHFVPRSEAYRAGYEPQAKPVTDLLPGKWLYAAPAKPDMRACMSGFHQVMAPPASPVRHGVLNRAQITQAMADLRAQRDANVAAALTKGDKREARTAPAVIKLGTGKAQICFNAKYLDEATRGAPSHKTGDIVVTSDGRQYSALWFTLGDGRVALVMPMRDAMPMSPVVEMPYLIETMPEHLKPAAPQRRTRSRGKNAATAPSAQEPTGAMPVAQPPATEGFAYRLNQRSKDGKSLWTSAEVFWADTMREVNQAIRAGFLIGEARWASDAVDGAIITGMASDGNWARPAVLVALRDATLPPVGSKRAWRDRVVTVLKHHEPNCDGRTPLAVRFEGSDHGEGIAFCNELRHVTATLSTGGYAATPEATPVPPVEIPPVEVEEATEAIPEPVAREITPRHRYYWCGGCGRRAATVLAARGDRCAACGDARKAA